MAPRAIKNGGQAPVSDWAVPDLLEPERLDDRYRRCGGRRGSRRGFGGRGRLLRYRLLGRVRFLGSRFGRRLFGCRVGGGFLGYGLGCRVLGDALFSRCWLFGCRLGGGFLGYGL